MNSSLWSKLVVGISISLVALVMISSYLINAEFYFNHQVNCCYKFSPDERNYKLNLIEKNIGFNNYDGVLLGSSSSSHIDTKFFTDEDIFNFSVSAMSPLEYLDATLHLQNYNSKPVKKFYISLEFFTSDSNEIKKQTGFYLSDYLQKRRASSFLFDQLIDYRPLWNFLSDFLFEKQYYSFYIKSENVNYFRDFGSTEVLRNIKQGLDRVLYSELLNYRYYPGYRKILMDFKSSIPDGEFIVFVPPVSDDYFRAISNLRLIEYKRWIIDIVNVFGAVKVLPPRNLLSTQQHEYFVDNRHYKNSTAEILVKNLIGGSGEFITVSSSNLAEYFDLIDFYSSQQKF